MSRHPNLCLAHGPIYTHPIAAHPISLLCQTPDHGLPLLLACCNTPRATPRAGASPFAEKSVPCIGLDEWQLPADGAFLQHARPCAVSGAKEGFPKSEFCIRRSITVDRGTNWRNKVVRARERFTTPKRSLQSTIRRA